MELQALLVVGGVGVAVVAVLLLMSLFSSSGTSYEEAIAQQRKATTELLALAESKNKPKKSSKKAIKKQAKKEKKESVVAATNSEVESEALAESGVEDEPTPAKGHVEFSPPVVVDIGTKDAPPTVKMRKRKDPKVRPILVNKEDPSCVSDPAPAPAAVLNHFEQMHPKDEFELLQATFAEKSQEKVAEVEPIEKKDPKPKTKVAKPAPKAVEPKDEGTRERRDSGDAPKEQRKAKKSEKKPEKQVEEIEEVVEETVPPLNTPQPSELTTDKILRAVTSTPPNRKKKKQETSVLALMAGDSSGVNVSELVRVVREAALSRTEIQILTDALLDKHHDPLPQHSDWTEGPNDPMQKLKKQLADKEKALADEIEASQALHAKLKELRTQLNAERSRATSVVRAAEEGAAAARVERHTLQARLQRLLDDNHQLAQDKALLQSKLGAEGEAQAQRVQMEMHIQRLSDVEANLLGQVAALQAECGAHALEAGQARCDASAARDAAMMAQQHAQDMAHQLQEANRLYSELEQQRQLAARGEQCARQDLQDTAAAMGELQKEVQRLSGRLQSAEASADKIKEDADKQHKQLSGEISSLKQQLSEREAELAEVKQLKAAPAQNGIPSTDELKSSAAEAVVGALRAEVEAAQEGARLHSTQLAALTDQLAHYQHKNNELRTKNWKVMEALKAAESALQSKALPDPREAIAKAQEAHYTEVANVLRTVCPSIAPGSPTGKEWLQLFADNLKREFNKRQTEKQDLEKRITEQEKRVMEQQKKVAEQEKRVTEQEKKLAEQEKRVLEQEKRVEPVSVPESNERLAELEAQNEHLQGLVEKYKGVIDDTEGVLSRLQHNVTHEEKRWAQQLADTQRELHALRHTTLLQMQSKIESLEAQLAQAQPRHNHSFADNERLTEESLMAGLSEKLNSDACNGPTQMELADK